MFANTGWMEVAVLLIAWRKLDNICHVLLRGLETDRTGVAAGFGDAVLPILSEEAFAGDRDEAKIDRRLAKEG